MTYSFGAESLSQLRTCRTDLQIVLHEAIKIYNFSVLKGHRNEADQNAAYDAGYSQVRWPDGEHNAYPSRAVDVCPYHVKYGRLIGTPAQIGAIAGAENKSNAWIESLIREHYCHMAGIILGIGYTKGVRLVWGVDWDRDNDLIETRFRDYAHIALVP